MTQQETLKPCPFCGGAAKLISRHEFDFRIICAVDCIPCKVEIYNEVKKDAINAWNTRSTPDHTEVLKIAREALERAKSYLPVEEGFYFISKPDVTSKHEQALAAINAALGEQKEE